MAETTFELYAKQKVDGKIINVLDEKGEKILVHRLTIRDSQVEAVVNPALRASKIKGLSDIEATKIGELGRNQAFYALQKWEEKDGDQMREIPKLEWPLRFKLDDGLVAYINKKAKQLAEDEGVIFSEDEGN